MRRSKINKISMAVILALMPVTIYAAGLGKLNVTSSLGEPFKAEIELISTTPEELESLVAIIASESAYASQGITRLPIHNDIKVQIVDSKTGKPKIQLTSNQAVTEPYVDMLIQLDWASGRLQREYTVLLDPPSYKESIKNEAVAEIQAPTNNEPVKQAKPPVVNDKQSDTGNFPAEGVDAPDASMPEPTAPDVDEEIKNLQIKTQPVRAKASTPTQHKTRSGDSLSKIASRMRLEGVSLDQMLVALYEQNKSAFVGENMNRLKVGKVIKLPTKEALLATTKSEASKTVQIHVADWNAYKTGLASATPEAKNSETVPHNQSESGKITTNEPATLSGQTSSQDVVKLSAGDKDKNSKDAKKAEEAKKLAEQEDKVAHDKALAEAQDRTTAVEKQIEDMQKLLALKNKAMTDLQKKAEADLATQKPAEKETNQSESTEKAVTEAQKDAGENASAHQEVTPETAKPEEIKPTEVKPNPEPEKPAEVKPPVAESKVEEPSFIASLLESVNLPMLGGLAGVGLLAAGWMFLRNKRRKDLESFERGILTSGGLRANTVFGNTTGNTSSTDTSFLTDFAQSTDGSMMDTNDVDPIAEAEVYMAYGRDAQAEEILKDAISKEPKRYELHLKLLEMYAARKDTSAFEAIAGELYTTLGSDDPTWATVAEMGKGLEPENPLYSAGTTAKVDDIPVATEKVVSSSKAKSATVTPNIQPEVAKPAVIAPDIASPSVIAAAGPIIENFVNPEDAASPEIELTIKDDGKDLNFEPSTDDLRIKQNFESADVENISFDSELELTSDQQYEVTQSDMNVADLNFDLNQEKGQVTNDPSIEGNLKAFDLSSISLDLDEPTTELTIEAPAVETVQNNPIDVDTKNDVEVKLNLVAAYIDMDDKEGARELLEEILKEGNDEQMLRAQMMLDSIS